MGQLLYQALDGSGIEIVQIIDRNGKNIEAERDILPPDAISDDGVDAMVVTVLSGFQHIYEDLKAKYRFDVISISELVR